MKKIKIVEVVSGINGGVGMLLYNYISRFDFEKFEVDIIAQDVPKQSFKEEFEKIGVKTYIIPTKKQNLIEHIKQMYNIFKENNYDISHFHMSTSNIYGLIIAKCAGIKIRISHSHSCEPSNNIFKQLVHKILNKIGSLFATQYYSCGIEAGKYLFGNKNFEKGKIKVINNAIEITNFKFDEEIRKKYRKKIGIENELCIGIVGRMEYQKNYFFAIDVFNELYELNPNVRLLIIGDGSQEPKIKQYVRNLNLEKNVFFLGKQNDVYNWYKAMDLFLLPSRYEGLPIVLIEAQVSGLPILVSENVTKEIKETDLIKWLSIKSDTPEIWAREMEKKLKKLEKDRMKYYRIMEDSKYNIEKEYHILEEEYIQLLTNKI